jgi:hypothetical protein
MVPYDYPRRLIRKMSAEDAATFAHELRALEVQRLRLAGKAWNTGFAMDKTEELAGLLESKLLSTNNPIAQEAYKQYFVEYVLTARRELGGRG